MDYFFSLHTHSLYSCLDAMTPIEDMVAKVSDHKQPGLGLSDHGNMSGSVQHYKECMKYGVLPFPGIEAYVVKDVRDKEAKRFHLTLAALDYEGYRALVNLTTLSHDRNSGHFHRKPRIDFADLSYLGQEARDNIVVSTGCYFGLLQQALINEGEQAARAMLKFLKTVSTNLYVEIQHHNIDHKDSDWDDTMLAEALYDLAEQEGLPVIVTQDSHYLEQEDKPVHTMMKSLVIHGVDDDDAGFPGDSFHVASTKWVRKHYTKNGLSHIWEAAQGSFEWLVDNNRMSMPALDDYKFIVPKVSKDPNKELSNKALEGLDRLGLIDDNDYIQRVQYELDIIKRMGFADYFLIVEDYVQWAMEEDIFVMARGSVNGSLVCYALNITQIDPIRRDIPFHRFLSLDRMKPPDIDLDIESSERWRVVEYIRKRFPDLTQIGTYGKLGANEETGKGALFVQFMAKKRRTLDKDEFIRKYGRVRDLHELSYSDKDAAALLFDLGQRSVLKAPGAHAAGFVCSTPGLRLADYVPLGLIASSDTPITQFDGDDVESLGFVKFDLLGVRTLSTIKRCLQLIGRRPKEGLEWIPDNDKETMKTLRKGTPDSGIFQFEGYSTAKGLRRQKPKTTKDCIIALALFRPANMYGNVGEEANTDVYLNTKARDVEYPHPIFKKHLKLTKGIPLFQDQVQDILRDLGLEYEELNAMMKAIKASNENISGAADVFAETEEKFYELCDDAGMTVDEAEHAWATIAGFSNYGFNRAHATAYGLLGYRAAYLKTHHPLEYATAMLETTAGTPKERIYQKEVRNMGISIHRADINLSGANWTIDRKRNGVRRGLKSIKGIGTGAAEELEEYGPYNNLDEVIERCTARVVTGGKTYAKTKDPNDLNGVLGVLRDANALGSLGIRSEY